MPTVQSLFIVNRAGGLIYQQDFVPLNKLSTNDYLRLASTFHGLHAIASNISPLSGSGGIEMLETDTFKLHCFQTPTNIKFIAVSEPHVTNVDAILHAVYEIYADYVLKNPFYELEMPIRIDVFGASLINLVKD